MAWIVVCRTAGCLWRHLEHHAPVANGVKDHHEALNPGHQPSIVWDGEMSQDWRAPVTFGRPTLPPVYGVRRGGA